MKTYQKAMYRCTTALTVALMFTGTVHGQEALPATEETTAADDDSIVVTATRSEQRLDKVPISISAYTQEKLDSLGVRSTEDLSSLTPGVNFERIRARASGTNIAIRGISSRIGAGTTGIYIDDAPIQVRIIGYDATNAYPSIFDLERVEVLRGPQGTLFGAGSMGGTVRFITPKPDLGKTSMNARAEIATIDNGSMTYEVGAAFGTPIIEDKLAVRLSGYFRRDGGWVDRANWDTGDIVEKNANSSNVKVFSGALTWQPTPELKITPSVYYQDQHIDDSGSYWSTLSDPERGVFKNGHPRPQPVDDEFVLPSLAVEYDLGPVIVTSNTSWFDREATNLWDYSTVVPAILSGNALLRVPGYELYSYFNDRQRNFTQEVRLQNSDPSARLNWVVGLFYGKMKQRAVQSLDAELVEVLYRAVLGTSNRNALGPLYDAGELGPSTLFIDTASTDTQFAGFGEVNFSLTEKLKLTAGVRVSSTKLEFANFQAGPFNGPQSSVAIEEKATPVTPRFGFSYQADPNNLFYANASKGFRIGGGNNAIPSTTCAAELASIGISSTPKSYESDSLWNYEIGAKNRLFGGKLQLATSAFYIKWKNIQQQVFLKCAFQYVDNVGGATSKGFDLQASVRVGGGLTLGANVGYVDADYTEDAYPGPIPGTGPKSVIVSDGDTVGVAPWNVTLTADYETPIGAGDDNFYGNITVVHRSKNKGQTAFLNPLSVAYDPDLPSIPAATTLRARIGVRISDFDLSLFANNITNSTKRLSRNHDTVGNPVFFDTTYQPRTIGLTAAYRY